MTSGKRYEILQDTKGRPALSVQREPVLGELRWFGGRPGIDYQVPCRGPVTDPEFAAMLQEAEKYLGTPYVWGRFHPGNRL